MDNKKVLELFEKDRIFNDSYIEIKELEVTTAFDFYDVEFIVEDSDHISRDFEQIVKTSTLEIFYEQGKKDILNELIETFKNYELNQIDRFQLISNLNSKMRGFELKMENGSYNEGYMNKEEEE